MTQDVAVGVVIPARDEDATIAATIRSVHAALDAAGVVRSCTVVVADSCRDGTATTAEAVLRGGDAVVEVHRSCVGAARSDGAAIALQRLDAAPHGCWLLSIDADSTAPRTWVRRHLAHAAAGVECVAGVVELAVTTPSTLRLAFERTYERGLDAGRHRHVHGTNLGIRGDTLQAVGGWPHLATGEDHALWAAVGDGGHVRVQDPTIRVRTSGRTAGRAPFGFADDLRALSRRPAPDADRTSSPSPT